jgi:hypothetical protein
MDITTTFDVDGVDETLADPEEIVGEILDVYNEYLRANGRSECEAGVNNMTAEWT